MPKQIWKIDQFHGGLSSSSDPRDIAPSELSAATDVMVDELGRLRMMGGTASHESSNSITSTSNPGFSIEPGYGLFYWRHDRVAGNTGTGGNYIQGIHDGDDNQDGTENNPMVDASGNFYPDSLIGAKITCIPLSGVPNGSGIITSNTGTTVSCAGGLTGGAENDWDDGDYYLITEFPETGNDYFAMADSGNANIDIYGKRLNNWGLSQITLGSTGGIKAVYYYADGALRISDANFGATNETMWYGYIHRWFWGNGTSGLTGNGGHINGFLASRWSTSHASIRKLELSDVFGPNITAGRSANPVRIQVIGANKIHSTVSSSGTISENADSISTHVDWGNQANRIDRYGSLDPDYTKFCEIGDKIQVTRSDVPANEIILTVKAVASTYIDVEETTDMSDVSDAIQITNLSRSSLFDPINPGFEFAMSTLYDDAKQESALSKYKLTGTQASGSDSATIMTNNGGDFQDNNDDFNGWRIKNITDGSSGLIIDSTTNTATVDDLTGGDDNSWDAGDVWEISIMTPMHIIQTATTPFRGFQSINLAIEVATGSTYSTNSFAFLYPRVSGFRIYMRRENTSDWFLQSEVDISEGHKTVTGDYNSWGTGAGNVESGYTKSFSGAIDIFREVETYESMTGYSADVTSVGLEGAGAGFKTAVISNRVAYVGNVQFRDELGNLEVHSDAILKSDVGKFDSFILERRLETSIRDGDEVVSLEEYADRLLIFKKHKMQLLNISQEVEFLEETFMHKGVMHPTSTCKTDYGIAWVNTKGVFLYDGQKVSNLFEKEGRRIIKESEWFVGGTSDGWIDSSDTPMIGYLPKKRQLIIKQDINSNGTGDNDIYLFDMVTQSWVIGVNKFPTWTPDSGNEGTNFIVDWNEDLVMAYEQGGNDFIVKWSDENKLLESGTTTGNVYYALQDSGQNFLTTLLPGNIVYNTTDAYTLDWINEIVVSDTQVELEASNVFDTSENYKFYTSRLSNDFLFITKDFDFGQPGQRKKIYKVYITYQSGNNTTNIQVDYDVNGGTSFPYDFADGTNFTSTELAAANGWQVAELKPDTPSEANNIKSFRLRFATDGLVTPDFEINDISIIYRIKTIK